MSDQKNLKEEKISEFERGLKPDNNRIGGYQSGEYANEKNQMNPLAGFGNVDLIYSGAFISKLFVKPFDANPNGFIFDSSDNKTGKLISKYGFDIMGLNKVWFDKRQSDIYRLVLQQQIKQIYKIA